MTENRELPASSAALDFELQFRQLLSCCPDGVLVLDAADHVVLTANEALCRQLGYPLSELVGLHLVDLHPTDEHERAAAEFRRLREQGTHTVSSVRMKRRDGSVFLADISASHLELEGRRCAIGFLRDVTARDEVDRSRRIKHDLMQALAACDSLDEGLRLSLDAAIAAARMDSGGFYTVEAPSGDLVLRVHRGLSPTFVAKVGRLPTTAPQARIVAEGTPVYIGRAEMLAAPVPDLDGEGLCSLAAVPLQHRGRVLGCLNVASHRVEVIDETARLALETIAAAAAQAISRLGAERALRAGEERLRKLVDNAADALLAVDPQSGRFLSANEAARQLFGAPSTEAVVGRTAWELSPERQGGRPSVELARELLDRALAEGRHAFEWVHQRFDGQPVLTLIQLVRVGEGEHTTLQASLRDITESRRAEQALVDSELFVRLALEIGGIGAYRIELPVGDATWSPGIERIWGLPTAYDGDVVRWFWEHVHPDDGERMRAFYRELHQSGQEGETEMRVRRPDGELRWVRWRARVFHDDARGTSRLVGVNLDITERKRLEEEREAALVKYRTLFDSLPLGLQVTDKEGRLIESNRVAEAMLGPAREAPLPNHPADAGWSVVHGDGTPMAPEEFASRRALREQRVVADMEMGLDKGAGQVTWLSVTAAPVPLPDVGVVVAYSDVSERKAHTAALAEREEIFSTIIAQAADAIAVVDGPSARFVEFNTAAHQTLGYSREEFARMGVQDIQAQLSPDEIHAVNARVRDQREAALDTLHRHKDGSLRDARVRLQRLHIRGRDYLAAVWTDVTVQRLAEARAARDAIAKAFLLELHQNAPERTGRDLYAYVLERAVRLTGSRVGVLHRLADDERKIDLTELWPSDADAALARETAAHAAELLRARRPAMDNRMAGAPLERALSVPVIRDGKVRILLGVANKASDYDADDAALVQIVANELDKIMAQRADEERLRASEERFRHLVEASFDWIWEMDAGGRAVYSSPRIRDLLGYAPESLIGARPSDYAYPGEGEKMAGLLKRALENRAPFSSVELVHLHADGHPVTMESSGVPVFGPDGRFAGFRGMSRDVTSRKRLEEQFRQAQKLEAVGQLAGGVAHDFNNVLAAILMHVGLMQDQALDAELRESLVEVEAAAQRAANLTRQLLMFSRRSVLTLTPLDLDDVVTNLLKMLSRLIGEHVELRFERHGALPRIAADTGMIEQILLNLVVNARDAMPSGGRIRVATDELVVEPNEVAGQPDRRPGRYVRLTVADKGSGMDAATLGRIFEPFFTTKEAGKGTGLGLATVHGIVAQHRGWVEVESTVGQGTTFRVLLPAAPAVDASAAAPTEPARRPPRGKEAVLVVEDEEIVRAVVARTLERLGYLVHAAANGQEALRLWQRHRADIRLLLTDMVMPQGLTGLDLAATLRAQSPSLKVMIVSGYTPEVAQAGSVENVVYVAKPFTPRALGEAVRRCLDS